MALALTPYLQFSGNARAAMEFYAAAFGGELTIDTFGEAMPGAEGVDPDGVMHASLYIDRGFHIMASDGLDHALLGTLSISRSDENDEAEAEKQRGYWRSLSDGATIEQPLEPAPWGSEFGMLVDKFGVRWMINI